MVDIFVGQGEVTQLPNPLHRDGRCTAVFRVDKTAPVILIHQSLHSLSPISEEVSMSPVELQINLRGWLAVSHMTFVSGLSGAQFHIYLPQQGNTYLA